MPVVDLRFVVHKREDVVLATKSLVEFNKVSLSRQKNYDAEAAAAKRGMTATTKLLSLDRKLTTQRKIEKQMVEDGLMSKKEQVAASERYDKILKQETRTLQDYIDTDRVLQKELVNSKKSEEALGKQRTKTKNETEKLRKTYDSTYAATTRYKQGLKDIDRAFEGMEDGPERASRAIKALKSDYQAFITASKSGGIVNAGNQFARYGDQAYRAQQRTKRFASVGLQQAGYQVNDFIVQIASGQNALVAFGQQGSQLAGIFGTAGAVVGALIAAVAAIGNLVYQYYQSKKGVEDLSESLKKLPELYGEIESMSDMLAEGVSEPWDKGTAAARNYIQAAHDAKFASTGEIFQRQLNAVEGWWDSISRIMFGTENVTGLATAIQTEIDKLTEQQVFIKKKVARHPKYDIKDYDDDTQTARINSLTTLKGELNTLFDKATTIEARVVALAGLRETYKEDPAITAELETLIKASGFHDQILSYYERQTAEALKQEEALDALVAKAVKMGGVTQANGARETLIAKHKREAQDELNTLKEAGVTVTDAEAKTALAALAMAHEAALAKFDALAAEKERLKVAKARQKAEKDADKELERALKSAQAIIDQQAKAYRTEKDRLDTQRDKNELLRIEEEHGKKSEQALDQRIVAAQNLVSVRMTEKFLVNGITDAEADLIAEAMQVAEQGVRFADSLQRSLENTRLMNTEISKMQGLINGLVDFGSGVEKKLAKAVAVGKALREGTDTAVAGVISDQMFDAQKLLDAAKAQALKLPEDKQKDALATAQAYYDKATAGISPLQKQLLENVALRESQKEPKKLPKTAKEILDKEERSMSLKLDRSRALLGLSETEILYETKKYALMSKVQEQMVTMTDAEKASTMARIDGIAREMAAREEQQRLEQEVIDFQKELAQTMASTFADNFMSIVDGTKSVAEAFKAMAADIVKHLFKVLIIQTMIRAMGGFMGSVAAPDSLMGNIGKGLMSYEAANGGVLNNGQVVPYANGGVVGGPTTFPMSGGRTGLMGEAGPEAIMPLKRGKDGKLGVQADGGSSSNVVIHQSFNFSANGDESVKKIIAEQAPAIANMTKQNILNDRRRGGQMRQAFG